MQSVVNKLRWHVVRLDEVALINPESVGKSYPHKAIQYIDISSVGSGTLSETAIYRLLEAPSRAKRLVKHGDTILSTVRPNRRSFLFIKTPAPNLVVSTGFAALRPANRIDARFLYYAVTNPAFTDYLAANMKGAAYPAVDTETIARATIALPPLAVQRKIAAILSVYDDLIENNTHRIQILEEMAQTIYREWFVEFRFPGHESTNMVDLKELGSVPEGWRINKVKDIVKRLKSGNTYTQSTVSDTGSVPVIDQSRKIFLGFHGDEPDHLATPENPIIIFGDHTCKMQLMVEPFSLGPNVVPFVSRDGLPIHFLYFVVKNLVQTREYKRHWTELVIKEVTLPPKQLARQFADSVVPMFEQINTLLKKNLNLSRTRDLLLPKLISGELDVEDLDIHTEGLGYG